jgi:hypothetical protein
MKRKAILLLGIITITCCTPCVGMAATACATLPISLVRFLGRGGWGAPGSYVGALQDLSHNGSPEAVVLLTGSAWCGSGGCTLLVLQLRSHMWHLISKTSIVRPPIRVLPERKHGWSSLSVAVAGGGVRPGYTAVLPFSGSAYPSNPTVPPALHGHNNTGTVIVKAYHCTPSGAGGGA